MIFKSSTFLLIPLLPQNSNVQIMTELSLLVVLVWILPYSLFSSVLKLNKVLAREREHYQGMQRIRQADN